jgi:hypothetical protein
VTITFDRRCSSLSGAGLRMVATTRQPWSAKRRAVASPIPEEHPVMKAVLLMRAQV